MIDAGQARAAAQAFAEKTSGGPVGSMERRASRSHHVFVSSSLVVKIIDARAHRRLDREIALANALPRGLSAPVLASGRWTADAGDMRYACFARLPGSPPGMGLPGVSAETARLWADQAIHQLRRLHDWVPPRQAAAVLRESLDHGGFTGRRGLLSEIERVRDLDTRAVVARPILDGLTEIAEQAPERPDWNVPVRADCHWDNWLVYENEVTGLLDFEWARFGEPADDWMFLSRFSGLHRHTVLTMIADATITPLEKLQTACEVRDASHVLADLRLALVQPDDLGRETSGTLVRELDEIVTARSWRRAG